MVALEDLYRPYRPEAPHPCHDRKGARDWNRLRS